MLIDWYTTIAQIVNFLILVYLLRRFLYGPIVDAMDQRQEPIRQRLAAAEHQRQQAEEEAEALRQRIRSAQDLQKVVKTMKTLAAVNVRHYERAAAALETYNRTVEMGLHIALHNRPNGVTIPARAPGTHWGGRMGAVVLGSDQGMCGQFNERIAAYAVDTLNGMQIRRRDRSLLVVGLRVAHRLTELHQPLEHVFSVPSSLAGITAAVQTLLLHIEDWRTEQAIERIEIFFNRQSEAGLHSPQIVHLLPLNLGWLRQLERDPWPARGLPFFRMAWDDLFAALVREHFFVSIYRAFAHSLASENASRLASMQAAERNIEKKLDEFWFHYQQQRQSLITGELLDIISGYEALAGASGGT